MLPIGARFGSLTVIGRSDEQRRRYQWECRCICGDTVVAFEENLKKLKIERCICETRKKQIAAKLKHGRSRGAEYQVWASMWKRCTNPKHSSYPRYGARGITVDPLWSDFSVFWADMGPRPSVDHSIDRIDNNKPYTKDNCRWATRIEQANNTSTNRIIEYRGRSLTLTELSRETGVGRETIRYRLLRGMPIDMAVLSTPYRRGRSPRLIEFNGKSQTMAQWADEMNLTISALEARLNHRGWTIERSLTTPMGKR